MYKVLAVALAILAFSIFSTVSEADPAAARLCTSYPAPCQKNPDLFMYNGQSLDQYNPLSAKVRQTGVVLWAFKVEPGCFDNGISRNIGTAMGDLWDKTGVVSIYVVDGTQDLTIRINCGTSFTAVCGGGSVIGCLGRGFPYNLDIDLSDRMADFYDLSQISIICHEYCGHALATWNEQYLLDGSFGTNPGWIDIMNTGTESRHYLAGVELNRWGRTMGAPAPKSYGYDPRGFLWMCGIDSRATGVWIQGYGVAEFSDLPKSADGCYGFAVRPEDACVTMDVGNAVDFKSLELRSDRTVCRP